VKRGALVIDTRPAAEFAAGHVPGTLNIPLNGSFVTWAGWLIPYDTDFYVIADDASASRLGELRRALALIGLDRVAGYFSTTAIAKAGGRATIAQVTVAEFARQRDKNNPVVIDVRHEREWNDGHMPSALHIPLGHLAERINEVPADRPVVVHCQGGSRSAIAASLLERLGFSGVTNLQGGMSAWAAAGLPVEEAHEQQATGA